MKFNFEGTIEEFQAVTKGGGIFTASLEEDADEFSLSDLHPPLSVVEEEPNIIPMPKNEMAPKPELGEISDEERSEARKSFKKFCLAWLEGWKEDIEQPDREKMMEKAGSGRWVRPVLIMAYEKESLQSLIGELLSEEVKDKGMSTSEWLDWIDHIACNMVQVSHRGFPELAGTYDYTDRWRRRAENE